MSKRTFRKLKVCDFVEIIGRKDIINNLLGIENDELIYYYTVHEISRETSEIVLVPGYIRVHENESFLLHRLRRRKV